MDLLLGVDAALFVVVSGRGRGGRRGGGNEAPQRIPYGGPPDVTHWSARGKKSGGVHPNGNGNDGGNCNGPRRQRRQR